MGVLGSGADQHDQAVLDRRQQRILLGLVEPVHFVQEKDRAPAEFPDSQPGLGNDLADVLDGGADGRQLAELFGSAGGDHACQRGLAGAGRSPQDYRRQAIGLDQLPQRPAKSEQVVLTHDLVERCGSQPGSERGLAGQALPSRSLEQPLAHALTVRRGSRAPAHPAGAQRLRIVSRRRDQGSGWSTS